MLTLFSHFSDLAAANVNPAIIVTAGTGAANDLDSTKGTALTNNATAITNFVNSGDGLMGHSSGTIAYGWLTALLPGISFPSGCSTPLTLTTAGQSAFPGLTNADISSGPCHNNFTGNFGGLQVLATDNASPSRDVILGGANVILPGSINLTPIQDTNDVGTNHTVTAKAQDRNPPAPAIGVVVTFSVTGANAGASGTCSANANCTTDSTGQVSWTYTGNNAGLDTIQACFTDQNQVQQCFIAHKDWVAPQVVPGRMTGGGSVFGGLKVSTRFTQGFELHCDLSSPNRLQINWGKGKKFHLTSLGSATCTGSGLEGKPVAGFDTFEGTGVGRMNGTPGVAITFKFTDRGEPGKGADTAAFSITGGPTVTTNTLNKGNHQAHP